MSRIIKRQDIQKGDVIVIHRKLKVATDLDNDGDFKVADGNWVKISEIDYDDSSEWTIELLNRPNPPLPTIVGSVIKVWNAEGATVNWMLHARNEWVNAVGNRHSASAFQRVIDEGKASFEVIA